MTFNTQFLIVLILCSVLASAFQFLLNLNHYQDKLQVNDDNLVKLKTLCKSRVSHFFFIYTTYYIYSFPIHANLVS